MTIGLISPDSRVWLLDCSIEKEPAADPGFMGKDAEWINNACRGHGE